MHERMYALHPNAMKKIKRRDNTISQDRDIDQKKNEVKQLLRKIFQLKPQVQQFTSEDKG